MTERLSPIDAKNVMSLEVGGKRYEGWKSQRIRHGIEQLAGTFSLEVTDIWPEQVTAWTLEPGAACTLKIGTDVMITGYVDVVRVTSSKSDHTITIEGRDKAGDLVDCSAPAKEWTGLPFEHIAVELCQPYDIPVETQLETGAGGYQAKKPGKGKAAATKAGPGGGKLPRKASNSGETVHRLLEKLAKIQGVLLVSDRRGGLTITRAGLNGRATDLLVLGENLLTIDYERSFANLFSEITVKGQTHGATTGGVSVLSGAASVKPAATVKRSSSAAGTTVTNASIERYRPLTIVAEDQADTKRCQDRAEWEAGTREARSKRITVTVQGWRQSDGTLWEINTLTRMRCPWVREDEDMLISNIEYTIDMQGGTICAMTLYSPKAFDVLKEIPKPNATTSGPTRLSGAGGERKGR